MEIRMKSSNLVLFLVAVRFSFSFGEENSENDNPTHTSSEVIPNQMQETDPESKAMEKPPNFRQRRPEYLITPDQKLIIEPRLYYPQLVDDGPTGPQSGYRTQVNRRKNLYLTDGTGRYNVKLQSLQQETPSNFQAALGAISAHILNQKSNQEYIPYPPNGDPYNYPAYRGHPRATEPPVIRAYERATNSNYNVQPVAFEQQSPRRFFSPSDYHPEFSGQFQNFGPDVQNPSEFFNDETFQLRRISHPIHESRWFDQREEQRTPIK